MALNLRTRLPIASSALSGTTQNLTGNVTGITSHSDSANSTLYVLGDTALNGVCHANRLKSTLPAVFQSDERRKKNFKHIVNPFYAMDRIPGYSFDYRENNIASLGFKAQDIEKIFPYLIDNTDGTKYVSYTPLLAVVWEATKKLRDRQRYLDRRVQALEEENVHLQQYLDTIPSIMSQIQQLTRQVKSFKNYKKKAVRNSIHRVREYMAKIR